ncbi:hypothetical protein QQF64_035199 [Cirrhinus molitorella]|uniref:SRCR domain-containing protein n=1 Tax=Cirrhinus molitorella TaxID=172907 RepID=A0ABR3NF36_9TELE
MLRMMRRCLTLILLSSVVMLIAASYTDLRLVNSSGRVELQYLSEWGTVCDACWDMKAASVLCGQLNCGIAVSVVGSDWFGEGSGFSLSLHDGLVRLSGERQCEGEVEVFIHQVWRRVLLDSWSLTESAVLQCGVALSNQQVPAWFGPGSGPIWLDEVECEGNETSLWSCSSPGWGKHDCQHKEDVGIICSEIRLSEGCEGNVEVFYNGSWGNVCHKKMDRDTASLICQELNCGKSVSEIRYSEGLKSHYWLDLFNCRRHDSTIWQCPSSPQGQNDCDEVARITCSERLPLRLSGGEGRCSGRLEVTVWLNQVPLLILIQQNRVMRRVLSDWYTGLYKTPTEPVYEEIYHRNNHFSQKGSLISEKVHPVYEDIDELFSEGDQEEYDDVENSNEDERNLLDWFGEGSGEIWADVFDCDGNETKLSECFISSWSRAECSHRRDVGVICSVSSLALHDGLVRLSGERQCEGEVEVFIHQVWRRVLLDSWSLTESSVVCRQLGCGSVLNFYGSSSSSPEHSHECVTGFQCSGSEGHLGNCSSPQTINCSSTQQLSIACLEFKEIRLTEGCEGNVEVFYNGSWGNVCYNQMDRDTASLICQELNCGRSGEFFYSKSSVESAPIWLDEVKCRPHDSNLWQCPSLPWGQNDCDSDEVAKITCLKQQSHEFPRSYLSCPTSSHRTHCSDFLELSVSSTPSTTSVTQTFPAASLSIPPVLVIVLGVVILLLLVPLLILIQQNKVMRRGLYKTPTEPIYEEIYHRHSHFSHRGSLISEELHSEYEDVDELFSGYYEDVIINGLNPYCETDDTPEGYYDDVITSGQNYVDTPEYYDDAISRRPCSQSVPGLSEGDNEEYVDDLKNSNEDVRSMLESAVGFTSYYNDVTTGTKEEQQITPKNYDDITVGMTHHSRDDISESYDDVVTIRQLSNKAEGGMEEYDDVRNVNKDVQDLSADYDYLREEPGKQ